MKSVVYFLVIVLAGALLGDFIGKLIVMWFPQGGVHDLFAIQISRGLKPTNLNLGMIDLTFGCVFNSSITGVLGIILAAVLSRAVFSSK